MYHWRITIRPCIRQDSQEFFLNGRRNSRRPVLRRTNHYGVFFYRWLLRRGQGRVQIAHDDDNVPYRLLLRKLCTPGYDYHVHYIPIANYECRARSQRLHKRRKWNYFSTHRQFNVTRRLPLSLYLCASSIRKWHRQQFRRYLRSCSNTQYRFLAHANDLITRHARVNKFSRRQRYLHPCLLSSRCQFITLPLTRQWDIKRRRPAVNEKFNWRDRCSQDYDGILQLCLHPRRINLFECHYPYFELYARNYKRRGAFKAKEARRRGMGEVLFLVVVVERCTERHRSLVVFVPAPRFLSLVWFGCQKKNGFYLFRAFMGGDSCGDPSASWGKRSGGRGA